LLGIDEKLKIGIFELFFLVEILFLLVK